MESTLWKGDTLADVQSELRDLTALLDRVRVEYREMPGLCLSPSQAARLWGLSPQRCARLLDVLIGHGDLMRTRDGRYVATSRLLRGPWRGRPGASTDPGVTTYTS